MIIWILLCPPTVIPYRRLPPRLRRGTTPRLLAIPLAILILVPKPKRRHPRKHRPQHPIPRQRTRPQQKPQNKQKKRKQPSERQTKRLPEKKKRQPGNKKRRLKNRPLPIKSWRTRPMLLEKRPRKKLVVRQKKKNNEWPCSEQTRRRKKKLPLHPWRHHLLLSRFLTLRFPTSKHKIIILKFQNSRHPILKCQKCRCPSFPCPKCPICQRSRLPAFPLQALAAKHPRHHPRRQVSLLLPSKLPRYRASLLLPSVVAVPRENIRRSILTQTNLRKNKKKKTKRLSKRERYLTKQMRMQGKSRIRQSSCELLPIRRRKLPRRPRMQRAKRDLAERFYAFGHLALGTRSLLFFSIILSRDCCHNHVLSSSCRRDNEENSSTTYMKTTIFRNHSCMVVQEKFVETLNTTGTNNHRYDHIIDYFYSVNEKYISRA
mmetsp:Transcript_24303/g.51265  ORF Transcript_24303/g.51265 Transcript_24303/m.51265 type:complete len:431 (+) Transcript_24303:245-1537(+)